VTSKRAASAAAKVLRDPKSSKAAKTAAGSALTQRTDQGKSSAGKGRVERSVIVTSPFEVVAYAAQRTWRPSVPGIVVDGAFAQTGVLDAF
jgi:hypothetical protein